MITWKALVDNLRCNPNFRGNPRYDGVIFHYQSSHSEDPDAILKLVHMVAQLIFVFCVQLHAEIQVPMALIQPMDAAKPRRGDAELGLRRVKARARDKAVFTPIRLLVRGTLLFSDPDHERDFFVVDTVDADMFVRVQSMYKKS